MRRCPTPSAWIAALIVLAATRTHAAPIVGGVDSYLATGTERVTLFANPLLGLATDFTFDTDKVGYFVVERQTQVGSTIDLAITEAEFYGLLPVELGGTPYVITLGPDLPAFTGSITNVAQDPGDPGFAAGDPSSFVSGDFRATTSFKLVDLVTGLTLYTDPIDLLELTSSLDSLPYRAGTVFFGAGPVDIYLQTGGLADPGVDPIVGVMSGITVTTVPEPPAFALSGLGAAAVTGLGLLGRRRRGRRPAAVLPEPGV